MYCPPEDIVSWNYFWLIIKPLVEFDLKTGLGLTLLLYCFNIKSKLLILQLNTRNLHSKNKCHTHFPIPSVDTRVTALMLAPFGIFCSVLKMGLLLMRGLALKKCMAGGKSALMSSSCFILNRRASSRFSASVRTMRPPVCMEASCSMRAFLWPGSG